MNDIAVERIPERTLVPRPNYTPSTFAEAMQFATVMAKSTMVPADYRGRPENILMAMQLGNELGLSPLQAVQSIAVINGKPAVYGDAMLGLVRASGLCEDVVETLEGEGEAMVARCTAIRRGSEPVVRTFSVVDAKQAGLWKKSGPWTQYPSRMLMWRARGFALRDAFADVLRGLISREEAMDMPREMVDVTPPAEPANLAGDLDAFAEEPGPHLLQTANTVAEGGVAAFTAYWERLSKSDRDVIRPELGAIKATAEAADNRRLEEEAVREQDPFDLPPLPDPPQAEAAPAQTADEPAASAVSPGPPEPTSTGDELALGNPLFIPVPKRGAKRAEWDYWERQLEALCAACQNAQGLANAKLANRNTLDRLRDEKEWPRYHRAQALLDGRTAEPEPEA